MGLFSQSVKSQLKSFEKAIDKAFRDEPEIYGLLNRKFAYLAKKDPFVKSALRAEKVSGRHSLMAKMSGVTTVVGGLATVGVAGLAVACPPLAAGFAVGSAVLAGASLVSGKVTYAFHKDSRAAQADADRMFSSSVKSSFGDLQEEGLFGGESNSSAKERFEQMIEQHKSNLGPKPV